MAEKDSEKSNRTPRIIVGGLVILFAVFLFVDFFLQLVNIDVLLDWWPIGLVAVGLFMVSTDKKQLLLGTALSIAGLTVLAIRLDILSDDLRRIIQIISLLLIGLAVVTPRLMRKKSDK